jgi:hypothetical protein
MKYRIEVTAVDPSSQMAEELDAIDAEHNGVIEFDEEREQQFSEFLDLYAGDAGEAFERMTITKVE